MKAQGSDLVDKVSKLVAHEKELEKKVAELERRLLEGGGPGGGGGGVDGMLSSAREVGDVKALAIEVAAGTGAPALRELGEKLRDKLGDKSAVLVAAITDGKAQLCVMVSKPITDRVRAGDLVREVAKKVGGAGGGRPDMAQAGGPDGAKADAALSAIEKAMAGA